MKMKRFEIVVPPEHPSQIPCETCGAKIDESCADVAQAFAGAPLYCEARTARAKDVQS